MHRVFVYGTLLAGHGNHRRLSEGKAVFLGKAFSGPNFTMVHLGGFPGIIRHGSTQIAGELYEVDDPTLASLDRLEGHPTFYRREVLAVQLENGGTVEAEGYVLPDSYLSRGRVIADGTWVR